MAKARIVPITGQQKQCCRCKLIKDTSEFHQSALRKDGLQPYCRSCKKVIDDEHYQRNPRRNSGRTREYRLRSCLEISGSPEGASYDSPAHRAGSQSSLEEKP